MFKLYPKFCPLSAILLATSCASAPSIQDAHRNYLQACLDKDDTRAQTFLVSPSNTPCPPQEETTKLATPNPSFVRIASLGSPAHPYTLADHGDGYRLQLPHFADPHSPLITLKALKYALQSQDPRHITPLLSPTLAQSYATLPPSTLNTLYAALAVTPTPWCQIERSTAQCVVQNILITLIFVDGHWMLHDFT